MAQEMHQYGLLTPIIGHRFRVHFMDKRKSGVKNWQIALLALGLSVGGNVQAALFIYQMPGGTRIITDYPLTGKDYKLVRKSESARGMGAMVSERRVQSVILDPSTYDRLIKRTAAANRVDVALVKAVMHVESGFNPNAVSPKGASGLMQLMPETAVRYGVEDIFDPVQNVQGGVRYLKDLLAMFKDNHRLAIAAYNAGEHAVLRYKGIPPYDETQDYVRKVMTFRKHYTPKEIKVVTPKMAIVPAMSSNLASDPAVTPVAAAGALPTVTAQNQL